MSTPGEPNGRFYKIQTKKPGYSDWWTRHVKKEEVIAAGRMDSKWAEQRRDQWGEESAVYLNRVEGEFAASDEDSVIPLSLIEKANERWQALQESSAWVDFVAVGADIARGGANKTALALRFAWAIKEIRAHSKKSTMETADLIQGILNYYGGAALFGVMWLRSRFRPGLEVAEE